MKITIRKICLLLVIMIVVGFHALGNLTEDKGMDLDRRLSRSEMRKTVGFACNDCTMTKSVNNCPDMGVCNRCANASSEEDVSCGDSTIEDGTNEYEDSCYLESEPGGLCAEADDKYCKKSYSCTTGSPSFGLDCSSVSGNCVGPTANWCSECSRRLYGSISSSKFSNNECEF